MNRKKRRIFYPSVSQIEAELARMDERRRFRRALGSAVCALNAKATALVVSATGAAAVRCIGHDYERHTIRCIAAAHTLAAKS